VQVYNCGSLLPYPQADAAEGDAQYLYVAVQMLNLAVNNAKRFRQRNDLYFFTYIVGALSRSALIWERRNSHKILIEIPQEMSPLVGRRPKYDNVEKNLRVLHRRRELSENYSGSDVQSNMNTLMNLRVS
jgi:hypothetical protein